MKRLGMVIDTKIDIATMEENDYHLQITTNGHYTMPIKEEGDEYILLAATDDDKKAEKLHKRFVHAPSSRIIKLLKNAGTESKKLYDSCELCLKYRRVNPSP